MVLSWVFYWIESRRQISPQLPIQLTQTQTYQPLVLAAQDEKEDETQNDLGSLSPSTRNELVSLSPSTRTDLGLSLSAQDKINQTTFIRD
jgi:hypothetical protein